MRAEAVPRVRPAHNDSAMNRVAASFHAMARLLR